MEKLDKSLSKTKFKNLKNSIEVLVENEIPNLIDDKKKASDTTEKIKAKILELNRPSFRYILVSELMQEFSIDWDDLYPMGHKMTLIGSRDRFIHTSKETRTRNSYKRNLQNSISD